jgi:hypothetical protein
MSATEKTLQKLAYNALPQDVKKQILSDANRKQHSVVAYQRSSAMSINSARMQRWMSSAKIPVKIQKILILLNYFTQTGFFDAMQKLKKIQWNKESVFISWSDYFDHFIEMIGEEKEYSIRYNDRKMHELDKWHFLIEKCFYLLCYKRMKHVFKKHDEEFSLGYGTFSKDFLKMISSLEETELLPFIIYKQLDMNYDKEHLMY